MPTGEEIETLSQTPLLSIPATPKPLASPLAARQCSLWKRVAGTYGVANNALLQQLAYSTCIFSVLAFLHLRVDHTMNVLSPFISVLCHSDWLFHGESCPHIDTVHPGRVWSSSPACTWHCSLHYLFLQATPSFHHGVTIVYFLALTVSCSLLVTPTLLRELTHLFFCAVHETCRIFLIPFILKASRHVS